ncbi:MAG: trimeric autotransporter adhesin [Actinomycetota bacterium]|nr:trimeric autotransporter adhesin [Actinomycetota bacterium]
MRPFRSLASALTLAVVGSMLIAPAAQADVASAPSPSWVVNGRVWATLEVGTTMYVGGTFTQVAPGTGNGVSLATVDGSTDATMPTVLGDVNVAIAAPDGGWYIAGAFTHVGGELRNGLARILPDGSVSSFSCKIVGGVINAMAISADGAHLYLGGTFTKLKRSARAGLGELDGTTGNPQAWNPGTNGGVRTLALSPDGSELYAGGDFTQVGGLTRNHAASIDPANGTVGTWNPDVSGTVRALAVTGDSQHIFIGGSFGNVNGDPAGDLAAVDASGSRTAWGSDTNGTVSALALSSDDSRLFIGGSFSSLDGDPRSNLGATNTTTGDIDPDWAPDAVGAVTSLAATPDGTTVYSGGSFSSVSGEPIPRLAALDATTGAADPAWDRTPNLPVYSLALSDDAVHVYVGGAFTGMGGEVQSGLVAIDLTTGAAVSGWDANVDGSVYALAASADGSTIYLGGKFTHVGGSSRGNLAAVDAGTGALSSALTARANGIVRSLVTYGDRLYAGGLYSKLAGQVANDLGAFKMSTGQLDASWQPRADGLIRSIAVAADGSSVYVAGDFNTINTTNRPHLAKIDATTGNLVGAFFPTNNGYVLYKTFAVTLGGSQVFAGMGGPAGGRIRAFDAVSGQVNWNDNADGDVQACAFANGRLYVGGHWDDFGNTPVHRPALAWLDPLTGSISSWSPAPNGAVWGLTASGAHVMVGGDFTRVAGDERAGVAVYLDAP